MSDTKVYEPYVRARLGTTAHFCEVVFLDERWGILQRVAWEGCRVQVSGLGRVRWEGVHGQGFRIGKKGMGGIEFRVQDLTE